VNISYNHYVPVLKLKDAEKDALRQLKPEIRDAVIPLFEVVERKVDPEKKEKPPLEEHLDKAFKKLRETVSYYAKFFLDLREIEVEGSNAIRDVYRRAVAFGHPFTPVTRITNGDEAAIAIDHSRNGVAIRLSRSELVSDNGARVLERFMTRHKLSPSAVDLILDLGHVESMVSYGVRALAENCLSNVTVPAAWRSLIMTGCDFPKSMGEVDTNSHKLVDRSMWVAWRELVRMPVRERIPVFSDCGIQHSTGVEGVDLSVIKAAPSIRYALSDGWLLLKGCGSKLPSEQYSNLAAELTVGALSEHFAGHKHCPGCDSMRRAAEREPEANSRKEWRRFGTIHHITRTVENIRAVYAQLNDGGQPQQFRRD
jgi:hypothetical protein